MRESVRFPLVLAAVCLAAAVGVAGVYTLTKIPIEQRQQADASLARKAVAPEGTAEFVPLNRAGDVLKAVGANGKLRGYVSAGEARGYAGTVSVMVGFDPELRVTGVAVTSQHETPGLGAELGHAWSSRTVWGFLGLDKTEVKSGSWPDRFKGVPGPDSAPEAGKVDAQTGATVTSNAIANAVHRAYLTLDQCLREGSP